MKILVINAGSSSIKYQLIDMTNEHVMAKGMCDRIGIEGRYNPKCRMTHMYKRFWKNMLEMDRETGVLRADERAPLDGPSRPLRLE